MKEKPPRLRHLRRESSILMNSIHTYPWRNRANREHAAWTLAYSGNWERAYNRLKKTNNFPEFTSRVCPALCENACTCGLNGDAVATRENEYAIIENAYEKRKYSKCFDAPESGVNPNFYPITNPWFI